jgi:sugar phosphate permease
MLALQIFFMVLFVAGFFQFVGWLVSLPEKIVNWYYDNRHKLK